MPQRWVGNSGRIIQVIMTVMLVVMVGAIVFTTVPDDQAAPIPWWVLMLLWMLFSGTFIICVWAVWHLRKIIVTVDDRGVTIRQSGKDRFIGWDDVEYVAFSPTGLMSAPGVQIRPKPQFFDHPGVRKDGVLSSSDWSVPGMSFTGKQLNEIAAAMKKQFEQAGGEFYVFSSSQLKPLPNQKAIQ